MALSSAKNTPPISIIGVDMEIFHPKKSPGFSRGPPKNFDYWTPRTPPIWVVNINHIFRGVGKSKKFTPLKMISG